MKLANGHEIASARPQPKEFSTHLSQRRAHTMNPGADMLNYRRQQTETDMGVCVWRGGGGSGAVVLSKCLTGFDCVWLGVV